MFASFLYTGACEECTYAVNCNTIHTKDCPSAYIFVSLRLHSQENQTPQEVKQEVLVHLREMRLLDQSIPSAIIIGPFAVSVEAIRQTLVKKRKALAKALLDRLALRLHQQMQDVRQCLFGLEAFLIKSE